MRRHPVHGCGCTSRASSNLDTASRNPAFGLLVRVCLRSGSAAVATVLAGEGRRFAGCEIDPDLVRLARSRVAEALAKQEAEFDAELVSG